MMKSRIGHTLLTTALLALALAAAGVSSASAAPKGEYAVFSQCPLSNSELSGCLVARTEKGAIKIGNQEVPISMTQTLQAGLINLNAYEKEVVSPTFSKTPQKVPGGLLGIKCAEIKGEGWFEKGLRATCEYFFEHGLTAVYATTELAGKVNLNEIALDLEEGTALELPVKVKLENSLFGEECYVGSNSNPVTLALTTGTSGSLKGTKGTTSTKAGGRILVISGTKLVDTNFSAPEAKGCGIFGLLDGIINSKLGLPASTGNTAELIGTEEQAGVNAVRESEEEE
jgi:hypothetical protein